MHGGIKTDGGNSSYIYLWALGVFYYRDSREITGNGGRKQNVPSRTHTGDVMVGLGVPTEKLS